VAKIKPGSALIIRCGVCGAVEVQDYNFPVVPLT